LLRRNIFYGNVIKVDLHFWGRRAELQTVIDTFLKAWAYAAGRREELIGAFGDHLALSLTALLIAVLLCVPLGIWTARSRGERWQPAALAVMNTVNGLRVAPSLAVLFLLVPWLGLNAVSAGVALVVLALPPVLINTDAAFRGLDPAVLEAARGMGMTARQMLLRVELPLALPVMLAGVRTAAVEVISSATLAAFVGAGGLGIYVTRGFAMYDYAILLVGAAPVALLTLTVEGLLAGLQKVVQPGAPRAAR
jgi:osmoprotectant transport system permease protein